MHPNPIFRKAETAQNLAFAARIGFGMLALSRAGQAPLLSHVPFVIEEDQVLLHLVRSNPMVPLLKTAQAVTLAVQGPHGYVSPDWYGVEDQVPTWNYVAVHLAGQAELLPAGDLLGILEKLSDRFEADLAPKPIWKTAKVDPDALSRMMRMIVPVVLKIEAVQGTWKLSQNKIDAARMGAAEGMEGTGRAELAALMRNLPVPQ